MLVRDVMRTGIEAFREDDAVIVVAMRMRDVETGFVPVCDVHGHPTGTVTESGLVRTVCAEDRLASKTLVGEVMERSPLVCYEDDDVAAAEERMDDARRSRILVLDRSQKLVGVLSLADLVRAEGEHHAVETARHLVDREHLA